MADAQAVIEAITTTLRAKVARERRAADDTRNGYDIQKFWRMGALVVEQALDSAHARLDTGKISAEQFAPRLLALLKQGLEQYEMYWEDEYDYGSSTIKAAIETVECHVSQARSL